MVRALYPVGVLKNLENVEKTATCLSLKTQACGHHLVRHREQNWFRLKPDLVIRNSERSLFVLDIKWKLLDGLKANGTDKYGLSQSDFYQLQAYGLSYLESIGDIILIYPKTDDSLTRCLYLIFRRSGECSFVYCHLPK